MSELLNQVVRLSLGAFLSLKNLRVPTNGGASVSVAVPADAADGPGRQSACEGSAGVEFEGSLARFLSRSEASHPRRPVIFLLVLGPTGAKHTGDRPWPEPTSRREWGAFSRKMEAVPFFFESIILLLLSARSSTNSGLVIGHHSPFLADMCPCSHQSHRQTHSVSMA